MKKIFTSKLALIAIVFLVGFSHIAGAVAPVCDVAVAPFGITRTTAYSGINVTYDYAANTLIPISEKGLCVSTSPKPTVSDKIFIANKPGTTLYEPILMYGLLPNTKYYVRAYAITTDYSVTPAAVAAPVYSPSDITFTTSNENVEAYWSLGTDLTSAVVGSITAPDLNIENLCTSVGYNQNTGGTAGTTNYFANTPVGWAKLTTGVKTMLLETDAPTAYLAFQITNNGPKFTINKLALSILGYKTGGLRVKFVYSLNGFTTAPDTIKSFAFNDELKTTQTTPTVAVLTANGGLTSNYGKENIFSQPSIVVDNGKTISFRMLIWGKVNSGPMMRDLVVSGTTGTATAILPSLKNDNELVLVKLADNLRIANASEITKFDVFSVNGTLIKTVQNSASEMNMDISGFRTGMYIVKGYTASGVKTGKFIR